MISVLMSVYNERISWIECAIESILEQTYKDFEFLIVNDCPNRVENDLILQKYASIDNRIILIKNSRNIGLTKSLNEAFLKSSGEFIARMDADDISDKHRFEKQLTILNRHPDIGVCGTSITEFGKRNKKRIFSQCINSEPFLFESFFAHSTVMIRRSLLGQLETLYDENYKYSQDETSAQNMNSLAWALASLGTDIDRAIELSKNAVELEPQSPHYIDTLGFAYYKKGDYDNALKTLLKAALYIDEDSKAEIYHHIADAYYAKNDYKNALKYYRKSISSINKEFDYDEEGVKDKIESLTENK